MSSGVSPISVIRSDGHVHAVLGAGLLPGDADQLGAHAVVGAVAADVHLHQLVEPERAELHVRIGLDVAGEQGLDRVAALVDRRDGLAHARLGRALRGDGARAGVQRLVQCVVHGRQVALGVLDPAQLHDLQRDRVVGAAAHRHRRIVLERAAEHRSRTPRRTRGARGRRCSPASRRCPRGSAARLVQSGDSRIVLAPRPVSSSRTRGMSTVPAATIASMSAQSCVRPNIALNRASSSAPRMGICVPSNPPGAGFALPRRGRARS